jgi:hypothetical protein
MIVCSLAEPSDCRTQKFQFSPYQNVGAVAAPIMVEVDARSACATKAQQVMASPKNNLLREGEFVSRYKCEQAGVFTRL